MMKTDGEKLTRVQKARLKKGLTVNGFTPEYEARLVKQIKNYDPSKNIVFTSFEELNSYLKQHGHI
jgi:hypothetical protein